MIEDVRNLPFVSLDEAGMEYWTKIFRQNRSIIQQRTQKKKKQYSRFCFTRQLCLRWQSVSCYKLVTEFCGNIMAHRWVGRITIYFTRPYWQIFNLSSFDRRIVSFMMFVELTTSKLERTNTCIASQRDRTMKFLLVAVKKHRFQTIKHSLILCFNCAEVDDSRIVCFMQF
mmetsp:Transcript_15779/g.23907  ORF Transcript_15779/g.23907 Transcript_15779/m.23907 type:complete len:171 (+) Transcript_15779:587-1099(+)